MARSLGTDAVAGMMAPETGFLALELLTITHSELASPLRVVNNVVDVVSRGELFTACGFTLTPPEEKGEGQPKATLVLNNADQWLTGHIRGLRGGFDVMLELVSASDLAADPPVFDVVEQAGMTLRLLEVSYDSKQVRGTLSFDSLSGGQFPSGTFTPTDFPGMF